MPKKEWFLYCGLIAFSVACLATPALAGFQWVAPDNSAAYQQPVYQQPNYPPPAIISGNPSPSLATESPEVISPVIISGSDQPPSAVRPNYRVGQSVTDQNRPNMATATIAAPSAPAQASGGVATSGLISPDDVVKGFATQVPLPLALRQIVPAGTSFSIDQSVDMETSVSYKGGKNWRDTLSDMLTPVGLVAHEQGAAVIINHMAPAQAPSNEAAIVPLAPFGAAPTMIGRAPQSPVLANTVVEHPGDVPMVNVGNPDGWSAERGDTLRKVLSDWCKRQGVELEWDAEYDYPMEASADFNGDFEDAVRSLLAGFENARPQPIAELHANTNAGQKILIIQARGNSYSN